MRCNPWRWLWGAVPLVILACVAVLSDQPRVEADLAARTKAALDKANLGWAGVSFKGREAVIAGRAIDENDPSRAFDVVRAIWGVGTIDNQAQLVERVDRFVWTATRFDDRVRFNGFVPNAAVRRDLVGMATPLFANLKIEHEPLKIARGGPQIDQWLAGVSFALKQLADLKPGAQVDLDGTSLSIAGEAATPKAYDNVQAALKRLPANVKLKTSNVRAPAVTPYTWSAKLDRNGLEVMGFAPTSAIRDNLRAAAEKADRKARVTIEIAAGNDAGFEAAAATALRELGQLESGEARLRDKQLTFVGLAVKEETADAVRKALKQSVPASIKLEERIEFREATSRPVVPYVTQVILEPGSARLSGHAPGDAQKAALNESIKKRLPALTVVDELQIGAGEPTGWQACLDAGIAALARLGNGSALLSDNRLALNGKTASEESSQAVPAELKAQAGPDCDTSASIAFTPPPEPHLTWRATLENGALILKGQVPDAATKAALAQSARALFTGVSVTEDMEIGGGSSAHWRRVAEEGLNVLARLHAGSALVEGDQLMITGEARDSAAQAEIRDRLTRLPKGYGGRETVEVRADPAASAEAEARRKAEADARRLAEEEARRKSEAEAQARADEQARAEAETRRRQAEEEARLRTAAAAAAEDARQRTAAAAAEEARRKVEAEVRVKAETDARARAEADACQALLRSTSSKGVITFKRASADIERESFPTLDALVRIVAKCPRALIQVEGHTDSDGTVERNQILSERRAAAVAEYLVRAGVAQTRLTAVGIGQTRPIASNDTFEGKSRNRRIEFVVRAQ